MKHYRIDIVVCVVILCLAVFVHVGRVGLSHDGVVVTTDVENYASMAAAMAHPDTFAQDFAYSAANEYGVHATIMTHIVCWLAKGENFGLAYVQLTGVQFFFHSIFFYFLGKVLLQKPWQAILFTIIMGQTYWIPWGTFWGNGFLDYVPRSTFATLYAPLVIWALHITRKPLWWPLFMFAMGAMVYIHSISALPAAVGFGLGFLCSKPLSTSVMRHVSWTCLSGACFLLPALPFVIQFLRADVFLRAQDVTLLQEILTLRYNIDYTHYWAGLAEFFLSPFGILVLPVAIWAYIYMQTHGSVQEKYQSRLIVIWGLGVGICAILYFADQEFARMLHRHPLEFDLIRALRFWVFFAMCVAFMGFNALWRTTQQMYVEKVLLRPLPICVALCWAALWIGIFLGGKNQLVYESALWFWNKADATRYAQAYGVALRRKEMLEAIMQYTEKDARIFDPAGDRAIRYKALRPLVYSFKDPSIYYYSKNVPKLQEWYTMQKALAQSPKAYMELGIQSGADYILSRNPDDRPELEKLGTLIWKDGPFTLTKVRKLSLP